MISEVSLYSMYNKYIKYQIAVLAKCLLDVFRKTRVDYSSKVIARVAKVLLLFSFILFCISYYSQYLSGRTSSFRVLQEINKDLLVKQGNFAYVSVEGDINCSAANELSTCVILEDKYPLPSELNNAQHSDIRELGQGRVSFWGSSVLFSTSDNSDPKQNGRTYRISKPMLALNQYNVSVFGLWILFLLAFVRSGKRFYGHSMIGRLSCLTIPVTVQLTVPILVGIILLKSSIGIQLSRVNLAIVFVLGYIILLLTLRIHSSLAITVYFTVIVVLVSVALLKVWTLDTLSYNAIGGLVPWSDTNGYYSDAFNISRGIGVKYSIMANRILHTAPLAVLLSITNNNLQLAVAIISLMWAAIIFITSSEIERCFGYRSGALFAILSVVYFSSFAGSLLSENTGFIGGGLSTALILNGIRRKNNKAVYIGLTALAISLNARNGAFIVIPAIVLWFSFTLESKKDIKVLFIGAGSSLLGFIWNSLFNHSFSAVFQYAPYTRSTLSVLIWGLVTHNSPSAVRQVIPGITNDQYTLVLNNIIIDAFRQDPLWAIAGILNPYKLVVFDDAPLLFGFMDQVNGIGVFSNAVYILFCVGLIAAALNLKIQIYGLFASAIAGILLSVPLTYFVGYRALAATAPFVFCTAAIGLSYISKKLYSCNTGQFQNSRDGENDSNTKLLIHATAIMLVLFIGPLLTWIIKPNYVSQPTIKCNGNHAISIPPIKGSYINIISNELIPIPPKVELDKYIKSRPAFDSGYGGFAKSIATLKDGDSLFFNVITGSFIILPNYIKFDDMRAHQICADQVIEGYLYKATYTQPIVHQGYKKKFQIIMILLVLYVAGFYFAKALINKH